MPIERPSRDELKARIEPQETADDQSGPAVAPRGGESAAYPSASDDGFIRFRRSQFYAALIPLALVAGLAAGYLLWGRDTVQPAASAASEPTRFDISADDDPALGPPDAEVTIIEFSDFACPYCRQFHLATFDQLLAAYPGQIRFVYRDFPITSPQSFLAAQAAECANEQGAFWEYHDALFSGRFELGLVAYQQYAEELGLDGAALMACVETGRYADEVQADARYAAGLGLTGTPTFFVNGIPLVGAQPLSQFIALIERELN